MRECVRCHKKRGEKHFLSKRRRETTRVCDLCRKGIIDTPRVRSGKYPVSTGKDDSGMKYNPNLTYDENIRYFDSKVRHSIHSFLDGVIGETW